MAIPNISKNLYAAPLRDHSPGDIWANLPTNGLLKKQHCSGLVITPACDLANSKVETLTYVPLVSVGTWFCMRGFYRELRGNITSLAKQIGVNLDDVLKRSHLPKSSDISFALELISEKITNPTAKEAIERCRSGCDLLEGIVNPLVTETDVQKLRHSMGEKAYQQLTSQLVTNGYSSDLHFLPQDSEDPEWSVIPTHSLALFRYPQTAPIEVFDTAQDVNALDWPSSIDDLAHSLPFARVFRDKRPLKALKLRNEYLSDLLTRYVGLYMRLGSPDFSKQAIEGFLSDIRG